MGLSSQYLFYIDLTIKIYFISRRVYFLLCKRNHFLQNTPLACLYYFIEISREMYKVKYYPSHNNDFNCVFYGPILLIVSVQNIYLHLVYSQTPFNFHINNAHHLSPHPTTAQPPTAVIEPEMRTVGTGQTASMTCEVTGSPAPHVTWSRGHGDLPSNHQVWIPGGDRERGRGR